MRGAKRRALGQVEVQVNAEREIERLEKCLKSISDAILKMQGKMSDLQRVVGRQQEVIAILTREVRRLEEERK
jgi:hypothetical protein